jgi:hypothetical protein
MEIDNPNYKPGVQARTEWAQDVLSVNFKNKKELRRFSDGTVVYKNKNYKLTYTLIKIYETEG